MCDILCLKYVKYDILKIDLRGVRYEKSIFNLSQVWSPYDL